MEGELYAPDVGGSTSKFIWKGERCWESGAVEEGWLWYKSIGAGAVASAPLLKGIWKARAAFVFSIVDGSTGESANADVGWDAKDENEDIRESDQRLSFRAVCSSICIRLSSDIYKGSWLRRRFQQACWR